MKLLIATTLLLFVASSGISQDKPQYASFLIPDSLKQKVNSVQRELSLNMIVKKPGKARLDIKSVVTVLNDKAQSELEFEVQTDKFHKVDDIEINVYDAFGGYIRRYRRKDLEKASTDDGMSLVTDDKALFCSIRAQSYPITVEYNYTIVFEGILEYPDFYPQSSNQSIQTASYTIVTEKTNKARYKNYRCSINPNISEKDNLITYTWAVKNVLGYNREPGVSKNDIPRVIISPTLFEMDDYLGDMSSWESFGKWQTTLINQTNKLPESNTAYYRNLVKDAKSEREKVQILYKHLQENYRYVGIQLGIGGWKPFPADFTEKKKYGDCKALSNFMQAMLNAVNIKSHYAIINAGNDGMPVDQTFPQNFSNHIILCVPQLKDTIWLECTSRKIPFGKLGPSTENRNAFLITETGGIIVPTPRTKPEDNSVSTYSLISLEEDGSGKATVDINHKGEFTDLSDYILEADDQRKRNYLINYAGYKQPDNLNVSKTNVNGSNYILHYEMSFEKIPDFSTGSKHFLSSRLYKFWDKALPKTENRQNDYYLDFALIQSDSTVYQLPEGFAPEKLPNAASYKFEGGQFQSDYSFDETKRQVITTCRIQLNSHIIKAKDFQDAAKFFSNVLNEQQQKIVVKKQ